MSPAPINQAPLLFCDTESGSLDPATGDLLEVAVIRTDPTGEQVEERDCWKVKYFRETGYRVSPEAQRVNGFDQARWDAEGLMLPQVMAKVERFSRDAILVAHNVMHDWNFLQAGLKECALQWLGRYQRVDTVGLAWPLLVAGRVSNAKLGTLCAHLGIIQGAAHTAADDAEACRQVYIYLISLYRNALQWAEVAL